VTGNSRAGRQPWRPPLHRVAAFLILVLSQFAVHPAFAANDATLPDFPVANGHFYSQASGEGPDFGYAITDDGEPFFAAFQRLGGTDALGYPASNRFLLDGLPAQATQRGILQWQPNQGSVVPVNIFDLFTSRGLDPALTRFQIPSTQNNAADTGLPWSAVVRRHLALLDTDPSIKARYFADPDPIRDFGLPQGVGDFNGVVVIRCERAAFQHWQIATPFARLGDVTQVNAGDLAKEVGLVPASATVPVAGSDVLIAPLGAPIPASSLVQKTAVEVARQVQQSLVRLDVTFASGQGIGSGILLDQQGDVLTNEHVVDFALAVQATFANGTTLPARIIGVDLADDLAVVRVSPGAIGPGVAAARLKSGTAMHPGDTVVALGFSPFFPSPPATRIGIFQQTVHDAVDHLRSDTYILPGDSGGPLIDLTGNVVGVNEEVSISDNSQQPLVALSIDGGQAKSVAERILSGRIPPLPYLGAETVSVTPSVEATLALQVASGALVVRVVPAGPAARAGITPGVVIVQAGGVSIHDPVELRGVVSRQPAGGTLSITYIGPAGQRQVSVVLGAWPPRG